MRPIVPVTIVFAAAAVGVWFLPEARLPAWSGLGAVYLGIAVWGTVSMRSGLFGRARARADHGRPEVALTFDDGPDAASTPVLLDLLRERGVRASFFCVGARARAHPDLVRRCHREGHLVANHSDSHSALTNFYPGRVLRRELSSCQATLAELTGELPRYYRPPMGLMSHAVAGATRAIGLQLVGWQVRGLDTGRAGAEAVIQRVLSSVQPGGIVLLHDGGQASERLLTIVRGVLDGLAERGLQPVRLDVLLEAQG